MADAGTDMPDDFEPREFADRLRPRARLLRTLGSELISSDKVALIELVKNSYDADATRVVIRFVGPLEERAGHIEIWDDGQGMDAATLRSSWLDIATDTKKRDPISSSGRRVLGEKGIGRLAAARLGHEMLMTTRQPGEREISLLIDWAQFDREGAYLDEVEVAWEVREPDLFSGHGLATKVLSTDTDERVIEHGTVIRMDRVTHTWTEQDLRELRTALGRLIRPRPGAVRQADAQAGGLAHDQGGIDVGFDILLLLENVPENLARLAGEIGPNDGLQTPHYRLWGHVNADGVGRLQYAQDEPPTKEALPNIALWSENSRHPEVGPFDFELNVWDRDRVALARTLSTAQAGPARAADLTTFRETLNEFAGVSIYRDNFRVLPFGERGDDWLGLDLRRVQSPTRRLSNNQIIGHVFIGADTNSGLRDQSNREGLLQGRAFSDLQSMMRAALTVLENKRYLSRPREDPSRRPEGGLFESFSLAEVQSAISTRYPAEKQILSLIDAKDRQIQEGIAEVQQTLSRYSRLATLGSLIDRILHDGRTIVSRLKDNSRFGKRDVQKLSLDCNDRIDLAVQWFDKSTAQTEHLSRMFNQIEPFGGRKRGRPREFGTQALIANAIAILQIDADESGVQLSAAGDDITVRLDESEALSVLINLVQNAIYWASRGDVDRPRKVRISSVRTADDGVAFSVSDTGPGVPDEVRQAIFDPYFSTKPEGVGLGLSIAGSIVDMYGGELKLVDGELGGAEFQAIFRRRV